MKSLARRVALGIVGGGKPGKKKHSRCAGAVSTPATPIHYTFTYSLLPYFPPTVTVDSVQAIADNGNTVMSPQSDTTS